LDLRDLLPSSGRRVEEKGVDGKGEKRREGREGRGTDF